MNGKCHQEQLCPAGSSCVPLGVQLEQKYACASLVCPNGYTYSKLTDACRAMGVNATGENTVAIYKFDTLYLPFDCVRSKAAVNRTLYRFVKEVRASGYKMDVPYSWHHSLIPPDSPCIDRGVNASHFQISAFQIDAKTRWPHTLFELKLLKPFKVRGNFVIVSRFTFQKYHKLNAIKYNKYNKLYARNVTYEYYTYYYHVYYLHVFVN